MINYDKDFVKGEVTLENIFNLLEDWGGEPEYTNFGIVSSTICHNPVGEGSRKLYYYENSGLFKCFTGCDATFDLFELCIKVHSIQKKEDLDLNDAVKYIAYWCGISGEYIPEEKNNLADWDYFDKKNKPMRTFSFKRPDGIIYNKDILSRFNYSVKIKPWLDEGITQEVMKNAGIGFYPGGDQITIPHFDCDGNLIGIRGRTLCKEEGEKYGKYRPLMINRKLYNHPLSLHLYNLNQSKDNIKALGKAIIFESEKSNLKYQSLFGIESDITVACCGSSISDKQIELLLSFGAKEIIIAFDRQFQAIGDNEFNKLKSNLLKLRSKYKNNCLISFIFDKNMITDYKASPIDEGAEKFLKLYKERIIL